MPGYDRYESLPEWAKGTLGAHARDQRPYAYSLAELEGARTHDEVWNAAQRELRVEGRIHNYLRMLWGKKILEWSPSPPEALEVMIHLNNKYARRRPQSQLLLRNLLVPRPLRSPLVPRKTDLRHHPLHELRQHAAQARPQALPGHLRSTGFVSAGSSQPVLASKLDGFGSGANGAMPGQP